MKSEKGKKLILRKKRESNLQNNFRVFGGLLFLFVFSLCAACAQKMGSQPAHRPLETSEVFQDKRLARAPVDGTIPSGFTRSDEQVSADADFDKNAEATPFALTGEILRRGRERFEINCAVCHGRTGDGDGSVVRRGFSRPPSFHDGRLRNAPLGHFYDVMTNGFGAMASYRNQVEPNDRWAIAAYIRVLQLSQNANLADVPPEKVAELEKEK